MKYPVQSSFYCRLEKLLKPLLCFMRAELIELGASEEQINAVTEPLRHLDIYRYPSCSSRYTHASRYKIWEYTELIPTSKGSRPQKLPS